MSLSNYLLVEGSLSEIIEVLTQLEDNSSLAYDKLFKMSNPESFLYHLFVKHMSKKERQIIEDIIKDSEYVALINEDDAQHMELLSQTHYLLPIQKT